MQWNDQNRHREARAAARLKALVQRDPKASGFRDRVVAAPKVSHGNQTNSRNRWLAQKRTVVTVSENGHKSCMATKNAQTPKEAQKRITNHNMTPNTTAITTMRMLDGKVNGTKKRVHGSTKTDGWQQQQTWNGWIDYGKRPGDSTKAKDQQWQSPQQQL